MRNLTGSALIAAGVLWAFGLLFGLPGQKHALLDDGTRFFSDYGYPRECAAAAETYRPEGFEPKEACYPPIGYAIVSRLPRDVRKGGLLFSVVGCGLFLAAFALFLSRVCGGRKTDAVVWAMAVLLSAPMVLALCTSNQILLSAAGVLIFLAWHDESAGWRRGAALLALAVASALKISPAVFSLLLLKRRDYRGFAVYALLSAALFLVPFGWFGGWDGMLQFAENLKLQSAFYSLRTTWGFVAIDRAVRIALQGGFESMSSTYLTMRMASVLLGLLCLYRFFRHAIGLSEDCFLLAAAVSLLPGPAQPYTALYLVPAMVLAIDASCPFWERIIWFLTFCVVQFPVGSGSINHALAGFGFTVLVLFRVLIFDIIHRKWTIR